jgi:transposase
MTGGRPSALTPEVQKKILAGLRCGLSRAASASRAGIGARTFREWMARTDDGRALRLLAGRGRGRGGVL